MAATTKGGLCGGVCKAGGEQRGLLRRLTERARRLEDELARRRAAAADKDVLREEAHANLEGLDALGRQQAATFGQLIGDYSAVYRQREAAGGDLAAECRARGRSNRERKRVLRAIAVLRATADRATAAARLLDDEIRANRARLEDADRVARCREDRLRQTERRLDGAADRLEAVEARDADARAACAALRDRAAAERAMVECLASTVADLRAGHDAAVRSARAELDRARDRLAASGADCARVGRRLRDVRGERDASAAAQASADREARRMRERCDAVGRLAALQARGRREIVGWLTAMAATAAARLGEVRAENGRLEGQCDELAAAARDEAVAEDRVRREHRRAGRAAELAAEQLQARRRRRTNEAKLYGRRLMLGDRELARTAEEQARHIDRLSAQMANAEDAVARDGRQPSASAVAVSCDRHHVQPGST